MKRSSTWTYDAFISYSHAADGRLAPELQSALERLGKPWFRVRALKIFRDKTGLGLTEHLWPDIERALRAARTFILLASPEAAASPWVRKELLTWIELGRPLYVVLTDGDLRFEDQEGSLRGLGSALPSDLKSYFIEEPLYLDLRWARDRDGLDLQNPRFRDDMAMLAASINGVSKQDFDSAATREHRRNLRVAWTAVMLLALLAITSSGLAVYARQQQTTALENAARADRSAERALANAALAASNRAEAEQNAAEAEDHRERALAEADRAQTESIRATAGEQRALRGEEQAKARLADNLFSTARVHVMARRPFQSLPYLRAYEELMRPSPSPAFRLISAHAAQAASSHLLHLQLSDYAGGLTLFDPSTLFTDFAGQFHVQRGQLLLTVAEDLKLLGDWDLGARQTHVSQTGLLFVVKDDKLEVYGHAEQQLMRSLKLTAKPTRTAFSESGHFAYLSADKELLVYAPSGDVPLLRTQLDASTEYPDVALSPRGDCLAVDLEDKIQLYDPSTGLEQGLIPAEGRQDMSFLSDNSLLIRFDKTFTVWTCPAGRLIKRLEHPTVTTSFAISQSGGFIAATADGRLLWSDASLHQLRSLPLPAAATNVTSVGLAPDDRHAAVGTNEGQLLVLDLWSGSELLNVDASRSRVSNTRFISTVEGLRLVTGSASHDIQVWSLPRAHFTVPISGSRSFSLSQDGKRYVTETRSGAVSLYDVDGGVRLASTPFSAPAKAVVDVGFVPTDDVVLIQAWESGDNGDDRGFETMLIWRPSDGKRYDFAAAGRHEFRAFPAHRSVLITGEDVPAHQLIDADLRPAATLEGTVLGTDDARVFMAGEGALIVREATASATSRTIPLPGTPARVAAGGRWVLVETTDDSWSLIDLDGMKVRCQFAKKPGFLADSAFSKNGRWVATSSEPEPNTFSPMKTRPIELWSTAECRHERTLTGHDRAPDNLLFGDDDSKLFASAWDQRAHFWAIGGTGHTAVGSDQEPVVRMTPVHGGRLAVADGGAQRGGLSFWDLEANRHLLRVGSGVHSHRVEHGTLALEQDSWLTLWKFPWLEGKDEPLGDAKCLTRWKLADNGELTELPSRTGICRSERDHNRPRLASEFAAAFQTALSAAQMGDQQSALALIRRCRGEAMDSRPFENVAGRILEAAVREKFGQGSHTFFSGGLGAQIGLERTVDKRVWPQELVYWAVMAFEKLGVTETPRATLELAERLVPGSMSPADLAEVRILSLPIDRLEASARAIIAKAPPSYSSLLLATVWARLLAHSRPEAEDVARLLLTSAKKAHEDELSWSFKGALEHLRGEGVAPTEWVRVRRVFNVLTTRGSRDELAKLLEPAPPTK